MSFTRFGVEWRYDTLIGFVTLILICIACTRSITTRLALNASENSLEIQSLGDRLDKSSKDERAILDTLRTVQVEQRVLEDKIADREKVLSDLQKTVNRITQTEKK